MNRFSLRFLPVSLVFAVLTAPPVVQAQSGDDLFELKKNFEIFGALYEQIIVSYVDDVRPGPFMKAGMDAMMSRLDPYTRYYDQAENLDMDVLRQGTLGDIGLNIGLHMGRLTVLTPETDTRVYRQGIRVGDVILRIDGVDVSEMTVQDVAVLLRGDAGTTVSLDIERTGEPRVLKFTVHRSTAPVQNVSYAGFLDNDAESRIGYVRLSLFGNRSAREVRRALRELPGTGDLKAIILDLRDNPGGILSEAIEMVSLFVPKGTAVVSTRGRFENLTRNFVTESDPFFPDTPVIVLVNRISASASEIVAGAFQDLDRAVIIGETTYGKGLVQVMKELPYNTSMKITIGHYYTPSGRDVQSTRIASEAADIARPEVQVFRTAAGRPVRSGVGIEPDVPITSLRTSEVEAALKQQGAFFQFAGHYGASLSNGEQELMEMSDDALFRDFEEWLQEIDFSYVSKSEILLDSLFVELSRSGYSESASRLNEVKDRTLREKTSVLKRERERIVQHIRDEIYARFLSAEEHIQQSLAADPVIERARILANSLTSYDTLLGK